jgi:SulP family sulfate permease
MAEIADVKLVDPGAMVQVDDLPPGVRMYEVAGPLFFGAAQKAMSAFETVDNRPQALILVLAKVPAIDATGLVALETLLQRLRRGRNLVILAGLQPQPAFALEHAHIVPEPGHLAIVADVDTAVDLAIMHCAAVSAGRAPVSAAA